MANSFETHRGVVYPWQLDHMDHMNVQYYVAKFDEATWNLCARLGLTLDYFRANRRGMAAVQQNITYRREMRSGDLVVVRSELIEIGGRKLRHRHRMYKGGSELEEAAISEMVSLHLDLDNRKSCDFPPEIVASGQSLMGADA